jgi:hypothetical protein
MILFFSFSRIGEVANRAIKNDGAVLPPSRSGETIPSEKPPLQQELLDYDDRHRLELPRLL